MFLTSTYVFDPNISKPIQKKIGKWLKRGVESANRFQREAVRNTSAWNSTRRVVCVSRSIKQKPVKRRLVNEGALFHELWLNLFKMGRHVRQIWCLKSSETSFFRPCRKPPQTPPPSYSHTSSTRCPSSSASLHSDILQRCQDGGLHVRDREGASHRNSVREAPLTRFIGWRGCFFSPRCACPHRAF